MRAVVASVPVLLAFGCAGVDGSRERDAMLETLSKSDSQSRSSIEHDVAFGVTLDRAALVTAVLARNPDLDVARETWRATIAAYPTVAAISDPMVTYEVAPLSIGSSVPFGQRIAI